MSIKSFLKRVIPAPARSNIRRAQRRTKAFGTRTVRSVFRGLGFNVARRSDFYSPLPDINQLRRRRDRWDKPSSMAGIDFDVPAMKSTLTTLVQDYLQEYQQFPSYEENARRGFGPGYTSVDAAVLYMMLRRLRPKRYLEVGSGLSTWYAHLAAKRNQKDGAPLEIACIEPYPYAALQQIDGVHLDAMEVQDTSWEPFGRLQAGDVLFIDSTHVVRLDGDVPYLILEVLPRLARGVVVHIHDISFPYNIPYPASYWVLSNEQAWPMLWTEAMMLQAFLCFNSAFRVTMSMPYLRYVDEAFVQSTLPMYRPLDEDPATFSSLWIEKVT
jgi:predicted O-methyltransferase YrrM